MYRAHLVFGVGYSVHNFFLLCLVYSCARDVTKNNRETIAANFVIFFIKISI